MPIINRDRKETDNHYRYKMPAIEAKHEGSGQYTRTLITNLKKVADALSTTPEIINHFLAVELGTESSSSSDNSEYRIFLRGSHSTESLQDHLDKYIKLFVKCSGCNIPEGKFRIKGKKKRKTVWVYCPSCGNQKDVTGSHKTSNYIKNNWAPENVNQDEIDAGIDHESKKKNLNLKIETPKGDSEEEPEWTINELDAQPASFGFQLPGMEMNGFQLPSSSQGFELPTSGLGINLNLENGHSDEGEGNENEENDTERNVLDDVLNDDLLNETILDCSSGDMSSDYKTACDLVHEQTKARRSLLSNILEPILGIYKDMPFPKFGPTTLSYLKKITEKLELDFEMASLMVSHLFDQQILANSQIENYRHLLEPFMCDPTSQQNFLNRLLVLVNKEPELMSDFPGVVENLYMNNLVDDYALLEWCQNLVMSDLSNELGINVDLPGHIFQILTPLLQQMQEDDQTQWEPSMSFGYQAIQIIQPLGMSPHLSPTFSPTFSQKFSPDLSEFSSQLIRDIILPNQSSSEEEETVEISDEEPEGDAEGDVEDGSDGETGV